jgi:hypothetical protein
MKKPTIRIYDCQTNETIDREMTAVEFVQYEKDIVKAEALQAEVEAKATAKAALLTQLGITAEQAKLLLS